MGRIAIGERGGGLYSVTDTVKLQQPALFSPPDPGLNQDAIEESELPDVIDLTELSDFEEDLPNTQPNVFLDCEAVEIHTRGPPPQKKVKFYIDNELQ